MGLRFRRSVGNKFFRLNFSGSGISVSTGMPGFHVNTPLISSHKRGRRLTMGLPGSGFSYSVQESTRQSHVTGPQPVTPPRFTSPETVAKLAHECAQETLRPQQPYHNQPRSVEILPPEPAQPQLPQQQITVQDMFWTWLRVYIGYELGAAVGRALFGRLGRRH
jgi:Protein of unknown function (DUF4236)